MCGKYILKCANAMAKCVLGILSHLFYILCPSGVGCVSCDILLNILVWLIVVNHVVK